VGDPAGRPKLGAHHDEGEGEGEGSGVGLGEG
jgi:hypothetical protein